MAALAIVGGISWLMSDIVSLWIIAIPSGMAAIVIVTLAVLAMVAAG